MLGQLNFWVVIGWFFKDPVKQIFFFEGNFKFLQELQVFRSKRGVLMMFFLIKDIPNDPVYFIF